MSGIDWPNGGEVPFRRTNLSATGHDVSLTRQGAAVGTLRVNLRWSSAGGGNTGGSGRRGLFPRRTEPLAARPNRSVDLDLGCLYEFTDGQRGVVQAVGQRSGDYARPPYIRLDRDDRFGSQAGENLFINMDQNVHFERILIFVMVKSGTADLTTCDTNVTFYPTAGPALEVPLTGPSGLVKTNSCAVAQIRRQGPEIVVHPELKYFSGYQSEIDAAFGWGLRWGHSSHHSRF